MTLDTKGPATINRAFLLSCVVAGVGLLTTGSHLATHPSGGERIARYGSSRIPAGTADGLLQPSFSDDTSDAERSEISAAKRDFLAS